MISQNRIEKAIKRLERYADTSHNLLKDKKVKNKEGLRKDNIAFNDAIEIIQQHLMVDCSCGDDLSVND